ncbi:hypothetical protein F5Y01DRAFT_65695 [Xylaria sp. FL0043]|nr:hypothetical protein F5Y01DRAFT_65695 [Xylaria sp. FL0043]
MRAPWHDSFILEMASRPMDEFQKQWEECCRRQEKHSRAVTEIVEEIMDSTLEDEDEEDEDEDWDRMSGVNASETCGRWKDDFEREYYSSADEITTEESVEDGEWLHLDYKKVSQEEPFPPIPVEEKPKEPTPAPAASEPKQPQQQNDRPAREPQVPPQQEQDTQRARPKRPARNYLKQPSLAFTPGRPVDHSPVPEDLAERVQWKAARLYEKLSSMRISEPEKQEQQKQEEEPE